MIMNKKKAMKFIKDFTLELSFAEEFKETVLMYCEDYEEPKGFFEDLQQGGCMSGMIGRFIYNSDCKAFYIAHIDDLEEYKRELEDSLGEPIKNRHELPHYTFVCWLCFEEYCYNLYREIYES